ncbi:hypothetical protein B0T21DRAFT_145406 [Apiosordaria backusii]|uniref:Uncharacterized protein n=1 Tax=Apiosordaria backusii TaxID=314023 RepID=A0AA40BSK0_9PEZI|nr:hypothetical protein B0T21DRAFT_145406 [Apiosordaria backusii]
MGSIWVRRCSRRKTKSSVGLPISPRQTRLDAFQPISRQLRADYHWAGKIAVCRPALSNPGHLLWSRIAEIQPIRAMLFVCHISQQVPGCISYSFDLVHKRRKRCIYMNSSFSKLKVWVSLLACAAGIRAAPGFITLETTKLAGDERKITRWFFFYQFSSSSTSTVASRLSSVRIKLPLTKGVELSRGHPTFSKCWGRFSTWITKMVPIQTIRRGYIAVF